MDINTNTSVSALVNSTQTQPPAPRSEKQPEEQQSSVVVKLSEQAQQMSRAENQKNNEQAEAGAQETAEPQGIQFMEGERKSGQISTYA